MSLAAGDRIGPYEIVGTLGRGGMGEVWRARDARLNRDVAIKALPADVVNDPDRRARFEREARILASLNHPNITAIYGVEDQRGSMFLVLELVEGPTLEDRLARGALAIDETLAIAAQIAAGLEAAHDAGVVHRDLKPANVKVRADGSVKILDLGLAKVADDAVPSSPAVTQSPTITAMGTLAGAILGTAAYMSPEQARGMPVDRRADIFAFGCVLYECLTGRRLFRGATASDVLAAIIATEADTSALPPSTPGGLRDLVRRCLRKDPRQRLQSIADARILLEEIAAAPAADAPRAAAGGAARNLWPIAAALALLAGVGIGMLVVRRPSAVVESRQSVRAVLPLPRDVELGFSSGASILAVSPDGETLVFRGTGKEGARLYRRALNGTDSVAIPGTEGGFNPFFSPDGEWLGFFTPSHLRKVGMSGGAPLDVAVVPPVSSGGAWLEDGSIVFAPQVNGPLAKVPASGGAMVPFTTFDAARGEHGHVWPQTLGGGRVLYTSVLGRDFQDVDAAQAVVVAPGSKPRVLIDGSSFARIIPGWIVFVRGSGVLAAPFDAERLEVTGPPVAVADPIVTHAGRRTPMFAASSAGTVVFAAGPPLSQESSNVLRVDRSGKATALPLPPSYYQNPRLSPDGSRLAMTRMDGMAMRLFVYEFGRQVLTPLTPEPGRYFLPVWSPDGTRIAFAGFIDGVPRPYVKRADGSGTATAMTVPTSEALFPASWFPDGSAIASVKAYVGDRSPHPRGMTALWIVPTDPSKPPYAWFKTEREFGPVVSPDGRSIAYVSLESGRQEVYLRPYPDGGRIQVSNNGGREAAWSRDGNELTYREGDRFLSVAVRSTPQHSVSSPTPLFSGDYLAGSGEDVPRQYDVSRNGDSFIVIQPVAPEPADRRLVVVTNWPRTFARPGDRR